MLRHVSRPSPSPTAPLFGGCAVVAACFVFAVPANAASTCRAISNPYPNTRYEGAALREIEAGGVSCRRGRQVVRGAHRRALGLTPPASGVRTFSWAGWAVRGDLRGDSDSYVARKGGARVTWRF